MIQTIISSRPGEKMSVVVRLDEVVCAAVAQERPTVAILTLRGGKEIHMHSSTKDAAFQAVELFKQYCDREDAK